MTAAIKVMLHPSISTDLRSKQIQIEANIGGFIGWDRLIDQLRFSGEVKRDERVEALVITDAGIQYFVKGR